MSEADIRRAMEDARQYEAWDKERRDALEIRNESEKLIFETEQALSKDTACDKETKKQIKEAIHALRKAVGKTKPDSITKEQAEELKQLSDHLRMLASGLS